MNSPMEKEIRNLRTMKDIRDVEIRNLRMQVDEQTALILTIGNQRNILNEALSYYANRSNWKSKLFGPEYVPATATGLKSPGVLYGWQIAEYAIARREEAK